VEMAPAVAEIMAMELKKDKSWEQQQVKEYLEIAGAYILN